MKRFPTIWFFAIGLLVALAAIPVSLFFKAQSVLWEISVADESVSSRLFLPKVDLGTLTPEAVLPENFREDPPPGTKVDEPVVKTPALPSDSYQVPAKEADRLDVLLLGIRGVDDPYGGTLTDSIILASYQRSTGKSGLISIPRDLYITIPFQGVRSKINYAYALGRKLGGERDALELAKHAVQYVTGVQIDYVARADFTAFEQAVDALGGLEITLDKQFSETLQWQGEGGFSLPAGRQTINGQQALYFVRSRYSTSDFDRARRQQQVLVAFKDRALGLNILTNPGRLSELLTIAGDHVRTDMDFETMKGLLPIAQNANFNEVKNLVFDNRPGGWLYSTVINKQYVLLPKSGTFKEMRTDAQQIF